MSVLVSRGGVFQSNLTNADVWDGSSSSTSWSGSGTSSSPYLISSASQLNGFKGWLTSSNNYGKNKYFKLTADIVLNDNDWTITSFCGNFDGNGHTIQCGTNGAFAGTPMFSAISTSSSNIVIKDLNLYRTKLANTITASSSYTIQISNVVVEDTANSQSVYWDKQDYNNGGCFRGGIANVATGKVTITNCHISSSVVSSGWDNAAYIGGILAKSYNDVLVTGCSSSITIENDYEQEVAELGGIVSCMYGGTVSNCYSDTVINVLGQQSTYGTPSCAGGIVAYVDSYDKTNCNAVICNNLFEGAISADSYYDSDEDSDIGDSPYMSGIVGTETISTGYGSVKIYNNISNGKISCSVASSDGNWGGVVTIVHNGTYSNNAYNSSRTPSTESNLYDSTYFAGYHGKTSDANMKLSSTYSNWTDFDKYWTLDPTINDGYPMLRDFIKVAKVTGFDGAGTSASPYLIKTHQDLLGVASYYNDNALTQADVYWQVANDIDVSKNANNVLIHFTPICYAKKFDGYFDGNGKTISGLLIDSQYEYTGLFGTIASNHYVKDLTVNGNIYWDQAYAVGGVAGRVLAGGYLSNCSFDGNIIGVLNTKTSTETSGVVGKYEINGAIDCSATYTDLKYAKIGGTTTSPTYTYYLYDWARITVKLYDKAV